MKYKLLILIPLLFYSFKLQGQVPDSPVLTEPPDLDVVEPVTPSLNWSDANNAESYELQISSTPSFSSQTTLVQTVSEISNFSVPSGALQTNKIYYWKVKAHDNWGAERWSTQTWSFYAVLRGDVNRDRVIDVGDVVYLINYLFKTGTAPSPLEAGDVNCDDIVDIGDVVFIINYLFKSGPPPGC